MDLLEKEARESVRVWLLYRWQDCYEVLPDGSVIQMITDEELRQMLIADLLPI